MCRNIVNAFMMCFNVPISKIVLFLNEFNRDSNFRNVDINMNTINCNSQCMRAVVDLYINKIQKRF